MPPIRLAAHAFEVTILPEVGGIVSAIDWRGPDGTIRPLLRGPGDAAPSTHSPNWFGLWGMVPFANRAFGGLVRDLDGDFTTPINSLETGSTIHGFGWQSAWEIVHHGDSRVILRHRRAGDSADPYRYTAQLSLSLVAGTVAIALAVVNEADRTLPFGIGLHPWFACARDTTLTMACAGELVFGEAFRATGHRVLTEGGPFTKATVFARGREIAHSFTGWDGEARIETPSLGLGLDLKASESLRSPVVWAPAGADFLCVEPQSHGIGAPSEIAAAEAAPITRLAPGTSLSGWLRLTPFLSGI
jgi:aldose 1-epimerase